MERSILHCDMNNFYASVECMLEPKLKQYPIAVGGSVENRHGIILAKNYRAKAFGVSTGEAIWQAKQKCPNLVVVPPHYEEYLKYSKLAREVYGRYTNQVEPYGMDECWLDISGTERVFGSPEEVANQIRETMKFELGLTISVGVSFNKIFAKLGSDMKKPDAVTVIPEDTFREKIWDLPASDLLGVGRSTEQKLSVVGIKSIGDLAQAPEDWMTRKFGKYGVMLLRYANGLDRSAVAASNYEAPVKSVGHGLTTMADLENSAEVWNLMLALVQDIAHKLRLYNKNAGGVAIFIRDSELHGKRWQCKLPIATHSASILAQQAFELFQKSYHWENSIRSVTVSAINLQSQELPQQLDMFSDVQTVERKEQLETVVEELRSRFGKYIIQPATLFQNIKMPTDREIELQMPTGMVM